MGTYRFVSKHVGGAKMHATWIAQFTVGEERVYRSGFNSEREAASFVAKYKRISLDSIKKQPRKKHVRLNRPSSYHGVVEKMAGKNVGWCAFATVRGVRRQTIVQSQLKAVSECLSQFMSAAHTS